MLASTIYREPKAGQQKVQLYYEDDPLCFALTQNLPGSSRHRRDFSTYGTSTNRAIFINNIAYSTVQATLSLLLGVVLSPRTYEEVRGYSCIKNNLLLS